MKNKLFLIFICLILLSVSSVSASDINQTNIDDVDNSVLSISNDVIVDTISASENDNLTSNDEYVDVNEAYDSLNAFRTEDNVWQWNEDDTTKTYFNTNNDNKLGPLAWDTALEETAKIRAKELSQSFSHTRPDGTICFTIFPDNLLAMGENIAMGTSLTGQGATELWKETNYNYDGQGHRRNMLSSDFNCVGIAGFEKDGNVYWVQDFGYNSNIVYDENIRPTPIETHETNNGLYVNSSVKVNGDGSKDNPFQDLKSALNTLETSGIIYIAPGNYAGENNTGLSLGSSNKNITLTNWTTGDVILDGKQSDYSNYDYDRVPNNLNIVGGTIIINGLTFKNFGDRAIVIKLSNPNDATTISNCNFINNHMDGENGGGCSIYAFNSNYTIINSNFINNSGFGGSNTLASDIYNENSNYVIINSNFVVDTDHDTYVIFNNNCHYIINNSTFTKNQYCYGGVIYNNNSDYTMNNSIFYNISTNSFVGGFAIIDNDNCNYTVNNCNFTNNSIDYNLFNDDISSNGTFNNCIFLKNWGYPSRDGLISYGNIIINNCIFQNMRDAVHSYGNISLYNNLIPSSVINIYGQIISPTTIYVLDNKTNYQKQQDSYKLNATIYDDNNNYISCGDFNFLLPNNTEIKSHYNYWSNEYYLYKANATLNPGENVISAKSKNLLNNTVKVGIINVENPEYNLDVSDVVKYYGGSERFIVNLTNYNAPLKNATVKITINGVSYNRTTNDKGSCSIGLTLNSGNYEVITEYKNLSVKSNVTIKTTIFSDNVEKIFKNNTQYYATFLDTDGSLLKNTTVQFNINGVMYYRTTDDKGVARLNINLGQGNYILTAINPISGEQKANNITVLPSIIENDDITKYYKNDTQYVVKVLNLDGSVAGAGVNVTFNINGVFYTRTTNASGYAKLNINLAPDEYTITAEYNTLRVSNKIKVLPVLSAKDLTMSYKDGSKFEAKLVDGQGNVYASQTIKFNINGVFYDRTTDANGIARLNINLMSGKYIITSMYNGAAIANEITIS